jgi:hypothetical protein
MPGLNGGRCYGYGRQTECVCQDGFKGKRCELKEATLATNEVIGITMTIIGVAIIIIIGLHQWHKYRTSVVYANMLQPNPNFQIDETRTITEQANELPYVVQFEFNRDRLHLSHELGNGEYGEVWLAQALGIHQLNARDESEGAVKARKDLWAESKKIYYVWIWSHVYHNL